ncbi:hypothetical protein QAD02_013223 [Eretmocerus hayati]|uniref:Uncharacterized protein n=1 Tax=Eretmocerus hayati TaxID=131215 RepID=A0ACC2P1Y4_9HYME|nr:hypothetical protein QAD02_013223 [Eretmocerus hayati]
MARRMSVAIPTIGNKDICLADRVSKFEHCHAVLLQYTDGSTEKGIHDSLSNVISKDKVHEEICLGLLMSILTDPYEAPTKYRDLTLLSRDGLAVIISNINQIIMDRYLKLTDVARRQVIWLVQEMMKTDVSNVDVPCSSLLRYAAGGDVSQRNISLIESLLDMFQDHNIWLDRFPVLIASVVYTFLRLIEDHSAIHLAALRQREVDFVITLLRGKIMDCLVIGR